jgi:hypothetical protein
MTRIAVMSAVALIGVVGAVALVTRALAYPPAVGILGRSQSCLACHENNGPWADEAKTIVDIIDKDTGKSLKQADGTFLVKAKRFQPTTVVTVIGRVKDDSAPPPYRNAWLYIDPTQIESASLSKFAPGWSVDLPMSCRLVGDKVLAYEGAHVTALPMTVRPQDAARNAVVELQVMLTRGEAVKGDAKKGMVSTYLVKSVRLEVAD